MIAAQAPAQALSETTASVGRLVVTLNLGTEQLHPLNAMSFDHSSESNLRSLFETALREYEEQAGTNLLDNSLTIQLQSCDSADAISAVLQEKAQAFHKFRGGDGKLIGWLKRTVHILHTLSTSSALSEGVGLVRWKLSALNYPLQGYVLSFYEDISTCKCRLRRNRYASRCMCPLGLIGQALTMSIVFRRLRMSALATMPLLTYSNRPKIS